MYGGDEVSAVVLDLGTHSVKAGYAGQDHEADEQDRAREHERRDAVQPRAVDEGRHARPEVQRPALA